MMKRMGLAVVATVAAPGARLAVLVGLLTAALACGASAAAVQSSAAGHGGGVRARAAVDPGYTTVNPKTDCPIYHLNGASAPELAPPHGEHCIPLAAPRVFWVSRNVGNPPGCVASLLVQDAIPRGTDAWAIAVYSQVGIGTQWFYNPGQRTMSILSGNGTYTAPKGSVVYGLGGGAGGGPCTAASTPKNWLSAAAWGVTFKRLVSGQLTVEGSGEPAAGVRVNANCPGGGTTTTDTNGDYEFLLDNGSCTIAPRLTAGAVSKPRQRVVAIHHHDVHHVDFQVPCDAVGSASGDLARAASASGPRCHLHVAITIAPKQIHSGMSFAGSPPSPRFFDLQDGSPACVSGCANVTVTVTYKGEPVPDATVSVRAGQVKHNIAPYPPKYPNFPYERLPSPGRGFLCESTDCGAAIYNLHTDAHGRAELLYWAPGLIGPSGKVPVFAHAVASHLACGCTVQTLSGEGKNHFTIHPNRICCEPFELSITNNGLPDAHLPYLYYRGNGFTATDLRDAGINQILTDAVKLLEKEAADKALSVLSAYSDYKTASGQEAAMTSWLLSLFKLDPAGIGSETTSSLLDGGLIKVIAGRGGIHDLSPWANLHPLYSGGLIYRLGKDLGGDAALRYTMDVDEISYCDRGGVCGPGDPAAGGFVHYLLYFEFKAGPSLREQRRGAKFPAFVDSFVMPYNPSLFFPPGR
jgi:hypothetical protein